MCQIHASWNPFEDYEVKPVINLAPYASKKQSDWQTIRPARIFYGGSQEGLMRKRQWFILEKMSYALVCSFLRVNNIIVSLVESKFLKLLKLEKG